MANLSDKIADLARLETEIADEKQRENPNGKKLRSLESRLNKMEKAANEDHVVENPMSSADFG